jgi:hypothetical protein
VQPTSEYPCSAPSGVGRVALDQHPGPPAFDVQPAGATLSPVPHPELDGEPVPLADPSEDLRDYPVVAELGVTGQLEPAEGIRPLPPGPPPEVIPNPGAVDEQGGEFRSG